MTNSSWAFLGILAIIAMFGSGTWLAVAAYTLGAAVAAAISKFVSPFASGGTVNSPLAIVGEKGPEIVNLPTGARVFNNNQSKSMMGSTSINVHVNGRLGASDTELDDIARKIGRKINLEMNRYNNSGYRA